MTKEESVDPMLSARNQEVMTRLATGKKAPVEKQEMRQLTRRNYEKLPEIIAKKEEARRMEELLLNKKR